MKKDKKSLVNGLLIVLISVSIIMTNIYFDYLFFLGNLEFPAMIFLLVLMCIGFIETGRGLVKPKPNYRWEQIKDKNTFRVLAISEGFQDQGNKEGRLVVDINGFGETLMTFPVNPKNWRGSTGPEKKVSYIKVDNYFIKI